MPTSKSNPPIEGNLDLAKNEIFNDAFYAKLNKKKTGLQFGKDVSAEDVKKLSDDFADVFATFRSLKPQPPYEYSYSQYQTYLTSLRLARIECFILDFFIKFSNGTSLNVENRPSSEWANSYNIAKFFTRNALFKCLSTENKDPKAVLQHNMKVWFKIAYLVLSTQLERYTNSAVSLTCISLQDIFKMMIPLFNFYDMKGLTHNYAPMQFNMPYLNQIELNIGSKFTRTVIQKVPLDFLFSNVVSRFGLISRINGSVQYLLGIHGTEQGGEQSLRFSIKDANTAHSELTYGKPRHAFLQKMHEKITKTKKRFANRSKEIQAIIDRECTSQHQKEEQYRAFKDACSKAGYNEGKILADMFKKVMKRAQVILYKEHHIAIPSALHDADFDDAMYDNALYEKGKKFMDNLDGNGDDEFGVGSSMQKKNSIESFMANKANQAKLEAMGRIHKFYSTDTNYSDARRQFMVKQENEIAKHINNTINVTMTKTVGNTRSNQNLYRK